MNDQKPFIRISTDDFEAGRLLEPVRGNGPVRGGDIGSTLGELLLSIRECTLDWPDILTHMISMMGEFHEWNGDPDFDTFLRDLCRRAASYESLVNERRRDIRAAMDAVTMDRDSAIP